MTQIHPDDHEEDGAQVTETTGVQVKTITLRQHSEARGGRGRQGGLQTAAQMPCSQLTLLGLVSPVFGVSTFLSAPRSGEVNGEGPSGCRFIRTRMTQGCECRGSWGWASGRGDRLHRGPGTTPQWT